jgi:hypothetical protein
MIIAAGLILAMSAANQVEAQKKPASKKTSTVTIKKTSTSAHAAKAGKTTTTKVESNSVQNKTVILPEREYMWENGQVATPAGQEATPVGGGYAAPKTKRITQTTDKVQRNSVQKFPLLHEREYMWENGQTATPTGNEATPVGGGYAALKKDTATKKTRIPE